MKFMRIDFFQITNSGSAKFNPLDITPHDLIS